MDGTAKVQLILDLKNNIKTGLSQAKDYLNKDVQQIKNSFSGLGESVDHFKLKNLQAFQAIENEVPGVSKAIEFLENPYVLATAVVAGFGEAVHKAMEFNEEWDERLLKSNAVLQLSHEELSKVDEKLNEIAAHGKGKWAYTEVADAFNEIVRSGRDANEALEDLEPAMKAAKANQSGLAQTAKTATDLMNASGVKDITEIYDMLAVTMKKGHLQFEQLESTLPSLAVTTKTVGLQFKDATAALATLTAKGEDAGRVSSRLEMTFRTMLDEQHVQAFKKIGVDVYDAKTHQIHSLLDILEQFNKKTEGLNDQQKQQILSFLNLDSRTGAAFLDLAQSTDKLKENMNDIANSSGELQKQAEATVSPLDSWHLLGNQIKGEWNDIGKEANEVWGKLGDGIVELEKWYDKSEDIKGIWSDIKTLGGGLVDGIKKAWQWYSDFYDDIITKPLGRIANRSWMHHNDAPALSKEEAASIGDKYYTFKTGKQQKLTDTFNTQADNKNLKELSDYFKSSLKPANNLYKTDPKVQQVLNSISKKENGGKNGNGADEGHITGSTPRTVNINIGSIINGDWITKNEQFQNMSPAQFGQFITEMLVRAEKDVEMGYN